MGRDQKHQKHTRSASGVNVSKSRSAVGKVHNAMPDLLQLLLVGIDALMLTLAFVLGYVARERYPLFAAPVNPPTFDTYQQLLGIHVVTLIVIFFLSRLYHQRRTVSRIDLVYQVTVTISLGVVMTSGLATIFLKGTGVGADYPRQMIFYVWIFSVILIILGREIHRRLVVWARVSGTSRDKVLIVGNGAAARTITAQITANPDLGYSIIGAIYDPPAAPPDALNLVGNPEPDNAIPDIPLLGRLDDLPQVIENRDIDEIIIALPESERSEVAQIVATCQQRGRLNIKIYPDLFAYMATEMSVDELGGIPLLSVRDVALRGWKLTLKRGLDIVGSAVGLVLLSPVLLLICFLIQMESPGAPIFTQIRVGLDGRQFPMIKFRSMRNDAEKSGPGWTQRGDARVTRIGKFLRRTNLDELLNLINVLLGHMSLVGPRPEQVHFVQQFRAHIPRYMERHREKTGMTGWAQVNGLRGDTSIEERIKYDIWYVENWSLWLDIKILLRTVFQTVLGRSPNAY